MIDVPLTHTNGENMPVSVSMLYNGYQAGSHFTNSICGCGWKLNYDQRIYYNSQTGSDIQKQLNAAGYHYTSVDADGTMLYLKHVSGGVYEDELKGYTFTALGTTAGWEMTDKNANVMKFDSGGKLTEIHSNQSDDKITLTYNGTFLQSIKDGADKAITIERNENNAITGLVDHYGRRVSLGYVGSLMNKITYSDGKYIGLEYDGEKKLMQLQKRGETKVKLIYPSNGEAPIKSRVATVQELSGSGTVGNTSAFDYSQGNETKTTDHNGHATNFTFNNYGRTISVIDETGAAASEYTATSTTTGDMYQNNKLSSAVDAPLPVNNLLKNHSFENGRTNWSPVIGYGADQFSADGTVSYLGQQAIKQNNTIDDYALLAQEHKNLSAGNYTFSVYVKTSDLTGSGGLFWS